MKSFNFVVEVILVPQDGDLVEKYIVRDVNGRPVFFCTGFFELDAFIRDNVSKLRNLPQSEEASK